MHDGGVTSGGVERQIRWTECAAGIVAECRAVALDTRRARRHLMAADPVMADLIRRAGPCRLGSQRAPRTRSSCCCGRSCRSSCRPRPPRPSSAGCARSSRATRRRPPACWRSTTPRCGAWVSAARRRATCATWRRGSATAGSTWRGSTPCRTTQALKALTDVLGIGTWTAEIFLLFQLHRPDILPVGDLGLMTAMQRVYGCVPGRRRSGR